MSSTPKANHKDKIRPFLRWAGGKQNLIKYLLKGTPDESKINKYWEPFLGAGSLFFSNGFKDAELSDINGHLINSYKQIKKDPQAIYRKLIFHLKKLDADYYYKLRQEFNEVLNKNSIEQAARFIFLVHTSFNGIYRVNKKGEYNVPIGKLEPSLPTLSHLKKISKKLKGIKIIVRSYEEILHSTQTGDFIYLDPPYPKLDEKKLQQQFTIDKFLEKHQKELAIFANKLNKKGCFVMISNSKIPFIEDLYKKWKIKEVPVVRSVSCKKKRKKVKELIITNY